MLLSMATALDLEASTHETKDHPLKNINSNADGGVKSQYVRPDDNCCIVYHGDRFSKRRTDPICWDLASGKPLHNQKTEAIKGLDCGKYTWVDLVSDEDKTHRTHGHKIGTAGRQHFNLHSHDSPIKLVWREKELQFTEFPDLYTSITIGPYDS